MEASNDVRLKYAGAVGLLCEISTKITDPEEKESLISAVSDWCDLTGWRMSVILDRVEVYPPPSDG